MGLNLFSSLGSPLEGLSLVLVHAGEAHLLGPQLRLAGSTGLYLDLGEANLGSLLFNQVLHDRASPLALDEVEDLGDLSGLAHLPDALSLILLHLLNLLLWDSARAAPNHVAESSQLRLGHDTALSRVEVSSLLSVKVSAEATGNISEERLESLDFHPLAIKEDRNSVLLGNNPEDSILGVSDIGESVNIEVSLLCTAGVVAVVEVVLEAAVVLEVVVVPEVVAVPGAAAVLGAAVDAAAA